MSTYAATLSLNVPAITALCTGPRGYNGATILTGSGVPSNSLGLSGDIYIDVQASYIYGPKTTIWGSGSTLTASTTAITTFIPSVLSAVNFVSYMDYIRKPSPLTYSSTGQDLSSTPLTLLAYTSTFAQSYIQNFSPTISASTDVIVANDIGAYIDLGINSSNYNGNRYSPVFNINGPNDSYLYNSFGNMTIGTGGGGGDFIIFTNGTLSGTHDQGGNESLRVKSNGYVGINTTSPTTNLTVNGGVSAVTFYGNGSQLTGIVLPTALSANWQSTYTTVSSNSASWRSTYTTVSSNSANWNYQGSDVKALTSNWQSTYTTVSSNSANWIPSSNIVTYILPSDGSSISTSEVNFFGSGITNSLAANSKYELEYNIIIANNSGGTRGYTLAVSGTNSFSGNLIFIGIDDNNSNQSGYVASATGSRLPIPAASLSIGNGRTMIVKFNSIVATTNAIDVALGITSNATNTTQSPKAGSYKKVTKVS